MTYAIKTILAGSPVSSSCSNGCTMSEHNRLLWDTKLRSKLKEWLESQIFQSKLQAALKNDNVDTVAELFSITLVEACKKAGLRVQRNKTKAMSQNNWFDLECETEKENLKSWPWPKSWIQGLGKLKSWNWPKSSIHNFGKLKSRNRPKSLIQDFWKLKA